MIEDKKNHRLKTKMLGTMISFNDDKVNECLGIDFAWNLNSGIGHLLTVNYRIPFHFISHVVVPQHEKQNSIIIFSLFLIWYALHGKWMNLRCIVVLILSTTLRRHKSC